MEISIIINKNTSFNNLIINDLNGNKIIADDALNTPIHAVESGFASTVNENGTTVNENGTTTFESGTAIFAFGATIFNNHAAIFAFGAAIFTFDAAILTNGSTVFKNGGSVFENGRPKYGFNVIGRMAEWLISSYKFPISKININN